MKLNEAIQDGSNAPPHVVIYGGPSTGKTRDALRLAKKFKLKVLALERFMEAFRDPTYLDKECYDNVDIYPVHSQVIEATVNGTAYKGRGFDACQVVWDLLLKGKSSVCVAHRHHTCPICKPTDPRETISIADIVAEGQILVIDTWTEFVANYTALLTAGEGLIGGAVSRSQGKDVKNLMSKLAVNLGSLPCALLVISHEQGTKFVGEGHEQRPVEIGPVLATTVAASNLTTRVFQNIIYYANGPMARWKAYSTPPTDAPLKIARTLSGVDVSKCTDYSRLTPIFEDWWAARQKFLTEGVKSDLT